MTRRTKADADREAELIRALIVGLDDATLLALRRAAEAQAAMFDVVAGAVPEQRDDAVRLRKVAPLFTNAIAARDFVEENAR